MACCLRIPCLHVQFKFKMCTVWNKLPRDLLECSSINDLRKDSKLITLNWLSMCDFFASCLFVCLLSELLSALCYALLLFSLPLLDPMDKFSPKYKSGI